MKKVSSKEPALSFTHKVIMSVLGLVFALGGYGGYVVYKQQGQYAPNFENNLHVVERVVDGDTLVLDDKSIVRLLLIDAPEIDTCFGPEAKQGLQSLVLGRKVRLQKDSTGVDENNRLLRYVFLYSEDPRDDNIFVNDFLLKNGFAKFYGEPRDKLFQDVLSNSAAVAKNNLKGLYKACEEESDIVEQKDPNCVIKANNTSAQVRKTYFFPGCLNYANVKMEKKNGDEWFCTEKEAVKAGYVKAKVCPEFTDTN